MELIIKHFDTPLITFNYVDKGIKGQFCQITEYNKSKTFLFPTSLELSSEGILSWLKKRVTPRNRENVDALLSKISLSVKDIISIIKISKGLSLIDCYWVVEKNFEGSFSEYNLFENDFEKSISLVAFTGYGNLKYKEFISSPEFTTNGVLKKAWRIIDNKRILYKSGTSGGVNTGNEPYSEFYASQIAKEMSINCVSYNLSMWKKNICSTCEAFTSLDYSYVQIYDFIGKKSIYEISEYLKKLGTEYFDSFVDMIVFDSLICNEDRHYGNFGLLVDNKTNKPISFAPLFDNGMSLFNFAMNDDFLDLDSYSKTRQSYYNLEFIELAKSFITKRQKDKLSKLVNFRFERHKSYNLSSSKLKKIEEYIQERIKILIN